ncbi:hypothetical protein UFOVP83_9 [uncultured Caudovirales phage]|uniref:Uncharacterized protein n=1 Tax=uncultured Caudovirales phage TaxID=2100421 RepID=A0A6J5TBT3_9CAUD|nr:hypothetical protein UFOVP83_9 [uncultured Caudovirales phage]
MTQAYNLSQLANKVNSSGQLDITSGVSGALPVANGGTGSATLTANSLLVGSGTGSVGTIAPGTAGNILQSNGTTWASTVAPVTGQNIVVFNASGTWTVPASVTKALVTVYGAGGGCGSYFASSAGRFATGGPGGFALVMMTALPSTVAITIGTGGTISTGSTTTSFGTAITCTGGGGGNNGTGAGGGAGAATIAMTGSYAGTALILATCGNSFGSGAAAITLLEAQQTLASLSNHAGILGVMQYGMGAHNYYTTTGNGGAVAIQY